MFKDQQQFHCIGTTTLNKYEEYIEKDPILEKCFQPILIKEISVDICVLILRTIKDSCA